MGIFNYKNSWLIGVISILCLFFFIIGLPIHSRVYTRRSRRATRYRPVYRASSRGSKGLSNLKQIYTKDFLKGYKISGTFNRTDIKSVLRIFYKRTGLNFIITGNIRGTVTGRFKDVPALEALITVLRVNNLYFIEEGSIIRIVKPNEYKQDIIKKNLQSKVYDINHADAKSLQSALNGVLTQGVGKTVFDQKSNKLMVTDLRDNFKEIERIIKELSSPGKQVYIDIKVVSITLTKGYEHGVNWEVLNVGNYFSFSSLFSAGTDKHGKIGFTATGSDVTASGFITALNNFSDTKILTSPKIVAAHGEQATIHIGDNIPYISKITKNDTTTVSESTVSFLDAGIKVSVTPYIGEKNTVKLKFKVEISSALMVDITDTQKAPQKTKTQAESMILCDNKALVVIGGLFENKKEIQESKVPLLGYIPILKYLFSWKKKTTTKREIAIMIKPVIIDSKSSKLGKTVRGEIKNDGIDKKKIKVIDLTKPMKRDKVKRNR